MRIFIGIFRLFKYRNHPVILVTIDSFVAFLTKTILLVPEIDITWNTVSPELFDILKNITNFMTGKGFNATMTTVNGVRMMALSIRIDVTNSHV